MTMRIDGDKGLIPQNTIKKTQNQQGVKDTEKSAASDKVSFSSVLQQVGQAQETQTSVATQPLEGLSAPLLTTPAYVQDVGESQEAARAARVEEIKAQVTDGSYQPDLKKVASSLLKFIAEGREV